MQASQQQNSRKIFGKASFRQRLLAGLVLLLIAGTFVLLALSAAEKIDIGRWLGPCGFKQKYGLPCPTCGIITSSLAFVRGKILEAFYIQPAGALLCAMLVIAAFLALLTAVFGVYFVLLRRFFAEVKIRRIILALIIIIALGWAVTLLRVL